MIVAKEAMDGPVLADLTEVSSIPTFLQDSKRAFFINRPVPQSYLLNELLGIQRPQFSPFVLEALFPTNTRVYIKHDLDFLSELQRSTELEVLGNLQLHFHLDLFFNLDFDVDGKAPEVDLFKEFGFVNGCLDVN